MSSHKTYKIGDEFQIGQNIGSYHLVYLGGTSFNDEEEVDDWKRYVTLINNADGTCWSGMHEAEYLTEFSRKNIDDIINRLHNTGQSDTKYRWKHVGTVDPKKKKARKETNRFELMDMEK